MMAASCQAGLTLAVLVVIGITLGALGMALRLYLQARRELRLTQRIRARYGNGQH